MLLKLHITKKDIMEANYKNFQDCPITRALLRAGIRGGSVIGAIKPDNCVLSSIYLFDSLTEMYTSMHLMAIVNRRVVGMQIYNGMLKQDQNPQSTPEPPDDINTQFDVDDIILTYK